MLWIKQNEKNNKTSKKKIQRVLPPHKNIAKHMTNLL